MAEVTLAELRRLAGFETRFEALRTKSDEMKLEIDTLKRALAARERDNAKLEGTIDKLVAENRDAASRAAEAQSARDIALATAEEKNRTEAEATKQAAAGAVALRKLQRQIAALENEARQLRTSAATVKDAPAVVTPVRLGLLLDEFVTGMESEAVGLRLQSGSMKLNVGVTDTKEGAAFVLPSATATRESLGPLHEMTVTFDPTALRRARAVES